MSRLELKIQMRPNRQNHRKKDSNVKTEINERIEPVKNDKNPTTYVL